MSELHAADEASASFSASPPVLKDPWSLRGPIPLGGPFGSISSPVGSFLVGLGALILAFVSYVFISNVASLALVVAASGAGLESFANPDALGQLLADHARELIIGNSIGQVFGLAIPALLFARLYSAEVFAFIRLRRVEWSLLGLSLLGLVALLPIVQWLASVNQTLPLPEPLKSFEESQMELIEQVLGSDFGLAFNLVMLAVVPGICEEVLFRGYVQRQFERGTGAAAGIALSGILFGLYHIRLTQALPLIVLGLYLAYITWRTGSLIPAMLVHFANNAFSVFLANYVSSQPGMDPSEIEQMGVPWYMVVGGFVFFSGIAYVLHTIAPVVRAERPTQMAPDRYSAG